MMALLILQTSPFFVCHAIQLLLDSHLLSEHDCLISVADPALLTISGSCCSHHHVWRIKSEIR